MQTSAQGVAAGPAAELSRWIWLYAPPAMMVLLLALYFVDHGLFAQMLAKDHEGGVVEWLTVALLLPGIYAGASMLRCCRHLLPGPWTRLWVLAWTLALVYFAGEEISWGQWLFHWETPQTFAELNDQNETNLHNISSWLDQKPRALVELWIFAAGLVAPLWRGLRGRALSDRSDWRFWVHPTFIGVPTAILFVAVRVFEWINQGAFIQFGSSELREYYIAMFLTIYLLSIRVRARGA